MLCVPALVQPDKFRDWSYETWRAVTPKKLKGALPPVAGAKVAKRASTDYREFPMIPYTLADYAVAPEATMVGYYAIILTFTSCTILHVMSLAYYESSHMQTFSASLIVMSYQIN